MEFQVGDLLFYRPHSKGFLGFFERSVCLLTGGPYCHVAIILDASDKHTVAQSLSQGFVISDEYGYLDYCLHKGWADVYRLDIPMLESQKIAILEACNEFKGLPYDWGDILDIAVYRLSGRRFSLGSAKRLMCSEAVEIVFMRAGVILRNDLDTGFITPNDLSQSPLIKKVS